MTRRLIPALSGLVLLAGTALAMPPIMDRIPDNASMVIVIPSIEKFDKDVSGMLMSLGFPLPTTASDMVLSNFGAQGISKKGSLAIVVDVASMESGEPPKGVVLFETEDYAKFTADMKTAKDGEMDKGDVTLPDGETVSVFMKKLDGKFVALSDDKEMLAKFEGKTGHEAAHKAFFGKTGEKVADKSDLSIFWNLEKLKPTVDEGLKALQDQMDMMGQEGAAGQIAPMMWLMQTVLKDASSGVTAVNIDSLGFAIDQVASFKADSRLAKATAVPGKSTALLNHLPAGPYLMVNAMDMSNPEIQKVLKEMPKAEGGEENPMAAFTSAFSGAGVSDKTTGVASVIGYNPGGVVQGLMTRSTTYVATPDPAGFVKAQSESTKAALEKSKLGTYEFQPDAVDVGGTKVAKFDMTLETEGMPMGQQMMNFMFGPSGGPSGYLATTDGGVVTTMSRSSEMMAAALKAAKGENTLASDKLLSAVGEKLPSGRMYETYIGTKSVIDTLVPVAAMFTGMKVKLDLPETLAPIGLGVGTAENTVHAGFYLPMDSMKALADTAKVFMATMGPKLAPGGEDGGKEDPMAPAEPKDKGKPKF